MIDSAAWCLIARDLGAYIFRREILEFGCIFGFEMFISYIKIMLVSLPALTMGLGGICIMDKVLRK